MFRVIGLLSILLLQCLVSLLVMAKNSGVESQKTVVKVG